MMSNMLFRRARPSSWSNNSSNNAAATTAVTNFFVGTPARRAVGATAASVVAACVCMETYAEYQESNAFEKHLANATTTEQGYSLPRSYERQAVRDYWLKRPVSVVCRVGTIAYELTPLISSYTFDKYIRPTIDILLLKDTTDSSNGNDSFGGDTTISSSLRPSSSSSSETSVREKVQAMELREALTNLGPAFVKAGQQLAIRPDLCPPVVLKELQKLCDSVRPIPDDVALQVIREELFTENTATTTATAAFDRGDDRNVNIKEQDPLDAIFEDLQLVASASLGQVYKGRLRDTGLEVAVKVQRPGMRKAFSLDLFLLQLWGDFMDTFTSIFTKQLPFHAALFDTFSQGSYSELDYENEAKNQLHFKKQLALRNCHVKVPDVVLQYSTERILTTEWIDGEKLADAPKETIRKLIPVGVELFLTQLLDIG